MTCWSHDWANVGEESVCRCCGARIDRPAPKKKRARAKAWQKQRRVMMERIGR